MTDHVSDPDGGPQHRSTSLLHPREPLATRLNRNALLVAAAVLGVTILVAIVLLEPTKPAAPNTGATPTEPPVPAQATFLDQPPRAAAADSGTRDSAAATLAGRADSLGITTRSGLTARRRLHGTAPDADTWNRSPASEERSHRRNAFDAARTGGVMVGVMVGAAHASDTGLETAPPLDPADAPATDSTLPRAARARADTGTQRESAPDSVPPMARTSLPAQRDPLSPLTLAAGTVIDGTLITGIVSDLPGTVVGEVSRDVFDSRTQHRLLIPRGSRLIGAYDNRIAPDQERLLVAWTRLILPNGYSLSLPRVSLTDRAGESGIRDRVDAHTAATYGRALLLSLIGAGAELSQPQQASVFAPPSARQVAAGAIGQQLSDVALESVRRAMDRPATITIRAGLPFAIVLPEDVVLDGAVNDHAP